MKTEALSCNNCGAPLDVPTSLNYVTCSHCGSRLSVNRAGSAHYTELIDKLGKRTDQIAEELSEIKFQRELEQLDRYWDEQREELGVRNKNGSVHMPDEAPALVSVIATVVLSVLACAFIFLSGSSTITYLWWMGLILVGVAAFSVFHYVAKLNDYNHARQQYEQQRQAVMDRRRQTR